MAHDYYNEDLTIAALLHDVIEDCGVMYNDIYHLFGSSVANLVESVTNTCTCTESTRAERKSAEFKRLAECDRWSKTLKLYDRVDNVSDLDIHMMNSNVTKQYCELYARESLLLLDFIGDASEKQSCAIKSICEEILRKVMLIV